MTPTISIRVNVDLLEFKKNQVVKVECDRNGVPLDRFWRCRLKDSETDNCCEVVKAKLSAKKSIVTKGQGKAKAANSQEPKA